MQRWAGRRRCCGWWGTGDAQVQKQALLASQKILLSRDKADFLANLDSGLAPTDDK